MIRFQNPNHTRIFVIFMTTLGVGTYFSPTLYRMFYLPRKLARERQERDAAELAQVAAGMWFLADYSSSLFSHSSEVDDEVGLNSCLSIKDWLKLVKSLKLCPQSWSRVCFFFFFFFLNGSSWMGQCFAWLTGWTVSPVAKGSTPGHNRLKGCLPVLLKI